MNNCSMEKCPMNASTFKECYISDGKCEYFTRTQDDDFAERVDDILRQMDADHEPVKEIPSAEPQVEQWKDFVLWVATEIFDDMWEYNKDSFAEIACRKLAKLGIVRAKGDEWELVEPQESEEV